jgi:hypothetical protein
MRVPLVPMLLPVAAGALALGLTGCAGGAGAAPSTAGAAASVAAQAASAETHITWRNDTQTGITITITDVANSDFDGDSRPDHAYPQGIDGYTLEPGDSVDTFTPSGTQPGSESFRMRYSDHMDAYPAWYWDPGTLYTEVTPFTYVDATGQQRTGTITFAVTGDYGTFDHGETAITFG